jgi:ADP-ribose pyrophosphatase YjhB (NUDIX family)
MYLATGLLRRGGCVLLVRGRYAGEPQPLWTLPGGRPEEAETLRHAVVREFHEETSLHVVVRRPAYLSESVDRHRRLHVVNCTFWVSESDPSAAPLSKDPKIAEVRFVPEREAPGVLQADVLRIPVKAALDAPEEVGYFSFSSENVAVPFFRAGHET